MAKQSKGAAKASAGRSKGGGTLKFTKQEEDILNKEVERAKAKYKTPEEYYQSFPKQY